MLMKPVYERWSNLHCARSNNYLLLWFDWATPKVRQMRYAVAVADRRKNGGHFGVFCDWLFCHRLHCWYRLGDPTRPQGPVSLSLEAPKCRAVLVTERLPWPRLRSRLKGGRACLQIISMRTDRPMKFHIYQWNITDRPAWQPEDRCERPS